MLINSLAEEDGPNEENVKKVSRMLDLDMQNEQLEQRIDRKKETLMDFRDAVSGVTERFFRDNEDEEDEDFASEGEEEDDMVDEGENDDE